jgi:hypothetical protein
VLSRGRGLRGKVVNILISYSDLADLLEQESYRLSIQQTSEGIASCKQMNVRTLAIT